MASSLDCPHSHSLPHRLPCKHASMILISMILVNMILANMILVNMIITMMVKMGGEKRVLACASYFPQRWRLCAWISSDCALPPSLTCSSSPLPPSPPTPPPGSSAACALLHLLLLLQGDRLLQVSCRKKCFFISELLTNNHIFFGIL